MPEAPIVGPPIGLAGPNQQPDFSTTRPKNAVPLPRVRSGYQSISKHVERDERAAEAREAAGLGPLAAKAGSPAKHLPFTTHKK